MNVTGFSEKIKTCSSYLIKRRNPDDGGWGLNIQKGFQASSIVNTTEAVFVINKAGHSLDNKEKTITFLKESIKRHPKERGNNLRYYTFGLWGLLELGVEKNDAFIIEVAKKIEKKSIGDLGWADDDLEEDVRMWPTFQALWILSKVHGNEYVVSKFYKIIANMLLNGRDNSYRWGFSTSENSSLAATSYMLILLSTMYPKSPDVFHTREILIKMIQENLYENKFLEIEALHGTDWHHYSYCWALKALFSSLDILDKSAYTVTVKLLKYIDSLFMREYGFFEPDTQIFNVRSIFNNVLALDQVYRSFDPTHYISLEQLVVKEDEPVLHNSVFLSFSYNPKDKALVEGLIKILEVTNYTVITGEKNPFGSLSKSIMKKIQKAEKFIVVMTCRDKKEEGECTTSSWLLEEKGAALALKKPCLMLVEEGVDDKEIGGLQGDDQRLHFNRNNFASIVADALNMID